MGDLKLLAAMGAWSGPFVLPHVLLLAALLAIALFVIERLLRCSTAGIHEERPFGPAIVAAYFIVMVFA
jgi:prepilin signal peptidase PulO-like enzyme (type II secretory pathway)